MQSALAFWRMHACASSVVSPETLPWLLACIGSGDVMSLLVLFYVKASYTNGSQPSLVFERVLELDPINRKESEPFSAHRGTNDVGNCCPATFLL